MVVSTVPQTIDRIEKNLEERIGSRRFQLWFNNSARLVVGEQSLCVEVANNFVGGWIENNFSDHLRQAAGAAMGKEPLLTFRVNPALVADEADGGVARDGLHLSGREESPRGAAPVRRAPKRKLRYTLDKFVVGDSNRLAYNAIRSVLKNVISRFNPLFIHGGCGLGKTHLLQGLCNAMSQEHPEVGWHYVSGEEFTNQFIVAVRGGSLDAFRRQYRNVDVLVIDDVHFISDKRATREEFLHTYNAIDAAGKQVIMASDAHPRQIGDFQESLVSRFISGMVVEIDMPDYETRKSIIEMRSADHGCMLPQPVIDVTARRLEGNVREIEGAVLKLLAYSSICDEPVNMQMAEKVACECARPVTVTLQVGKIECCVADYFGVKVTDIRMSKRTRTIALSRGVAMYLARKHTAMSFPEIGRAMGNKNHSTVILACKRIDKTLTSGQEVTWDGESGRNSLQLVDVIAEIEQAMGCND